MLTRSLIIFYIENFDKLEQSKKKIHFSDNILYFARKKRRNLNLSNVTFFFCYSIILVIGAHIANLIT